VDNFWNFQPNLAEWMILKFMDNSDKFSYLISPVFTFEQSFLTALGPLFQPGS